MNRLHSSTDNGEQRGSEDSSWHFADKIQALRAERALSRRAFGDLVGVSSETVRSWEKGRRRPSDTALALISSRLGLSSRERRTLVGVSGEHPLRALDLIEVRRAQPNAAGAELARYAWPTLIVNERHELLAWNSLADAVAEVSLAEMLPTQAERSLLWMASLDHFQRRLHNWDELIGRLVSTLRLEGVAIERGGPPPPYLHALVNRLDVERPEALARFYRLWLQPDEWSEGMRNLHPIEWRLADGTMLRFVGAFRDWSVFDGSFAFDWLPADAATGWWIEEALKRVGMGVTTSPAVGPWGTGFASWLRTERHRLGLSRRSLAERSGVSADAVYAYEQGRRRPGRDSLLRVMAALTVDGHTTNHWLRQFGYAETPSDFSRAVLGIAPLGIMQDHQPIHGVTDAQRKAELARTPWPCFMLNSRCQIEATNAPARRIFPTASLGGSRSQEGHDLLEFMLSSICRQHIKNWSEVAGSVLPTALKPFVLGRSTDPSATPTALGARMAALRRGNAEALRDLLAAWSDRVASATPQRIAFPLEWETSSGELLRFHCFVNPWNAFDPYWAIDWHPANRAAWEALR